MAAIAIPSIVGFKQKKFDLMYNQLMTPDGYGSVQTQERVRPVWYAEYTTPPLQDSRLDEFQAFLDALGGSLFTFLAYDPDRIMPGAYKTLPVASDPWTQAGQTNPRVTAYSYSNSTLTLDRLANGAVISKRDYIQVTDNNGSIQLYRVVVGATAASNAATITVVPRPNNLVANAAVIYRKAAAEMKIVGKVSPQSDVGQGTVFTFKAGQFIKRG